MSIYISVIRPIIYYTVETRVEGRAQKLSKRKQMNTLGKFWVKQD